MWMAGSTAVDVAEQATHFVKSFDGDGRTTARLEYELGTLRHQVVVLEHAVAIRAPRRPAETSESLSRLTSGGAR